MQNEIVDKRSAALAKNDVEDDKSSLWSGESDSSPDIRKQLSNEKRQRRIANEMRMVPLPDLDVDDFDHGDIEEPPDDDEEMK